MKARKRAAPRHRARRAPQRARRGAPMRGPMRRKKPTGIRKKRVKAPIIPLTPRGSPPSYFELLQEAVLTLKETGAGASLPEIRRQLQKRYKGRFDKAGDKLLTTALQRLAERGKVICKKGYRYRFNAPKVSKPRKSGGSASASSSAYAGTSRSGATSGSAPSDATDATDATAGSHTSASSSSASGTNRSGKSSAKDGGAPKDGDDVPKGASPGKNVDGEGKSTSGDDFSSSAASASSTASRRASSRKR